ncbi:M12 family metallo-peptidase [Haloplanus halophilus]|uniref:M12 family metallo-peptidase n=1 Tax=Haloplanus halophilus TaxID=2949993 RepID=UPI00203EE3B9|nr:M12 family metallo-peptidase [Haloplanus sp. GDY1]
MAARTLVLVGLLLLAGCTTPFDPAAAPTDTPVPAASDPTATPGATATATAPAATATPSANPWGSDPIVVAVRNGGEPGRDVDSLVREATAFWEANDGAYLGFEVRYEVRPDAEDPDLVVAFTDTLPDCGGVADAVGCAPKLTDARMVDRPETVWVKTGLSDDSTTLVTKHELGHTLGLDHDDAPRDVMRARSVIYTEPQPNATERAFPWADGEFTVRVDAENASDPAGVDRQVGHALSYYEAGAPGMPDDLSFERTGAADAEIRVRFGETATCRASSGSCVSTYGTDPDGDGAIETYTRVEITLVGLDTDAVGWHVGYWLAHAFGAEADGEKPPPFRDASYRERRSAWWE